MGMPRTTFELIIIIFWFFYGEGIRLMKIAINGFGRIGRLICRLMALNPVHCFEVTAINDLVPADNLAYLLKYDSVHGQLPLNIWNDGSFLIVNDKKMKIFNEKKPLSLPWKELEIDYVIESSGHFTSLQEANQHIEAGARGVIITAPAGDKIPTFVMGVNHEKYNPLKDKVVSNASCTTNCLAILTKILLDHFGIEEGLMTTVHSLTASQSTVDTPSKRDWRAGRAASLNIIPSSTGAAKAVELCLPEVKGKLTGMAFRVPTADVSVVDLTVRLKRDTSYEEICSVIKEGSEGPYKGLLTYCEDPVVSSDFIGTSSSCIFDKGAGIALNSRFYKLIAWYDNEVGYAQRVIDLMKYMANKNSNIQSCCA